MVGQSKLTSTEIIDEIELDDSTVELTAVVDKRIAAETAANGRKVFKIVVSNNEVGDRNRKIMVTAWENDINRLMKVAQVNTVLQFVNIQSKSPPAQKYHLGNAHFILNLKHITKINTKGELKEEEIIHVDTLKFTSLKTIAKFAGEMKLQVYIQNTLEQLITSNVNAKNGAVTDGKYKLEVQTIDSGEKNDELVDVQKGDKVELTGRLQINPKSPPIFKIKSLNEIKILNEPKMDVSDLCRWKEYIPY